MNCTTWNGWRRRGRTRREKTGPAAREKQHNIIHLLSVQTPQRLMYDWSMEKKGGVSLSADISLIELRWNTLAKHTIIKVSWNSFINGYECFFRNIFQFMMDLTTKYHRRYHTFLTSKVKCKVPPHSSDCETWSSMWDLLWKTKTIWK